MIKNGFCNMVAVQIANDQYKPATTHRNGINMQKWQKYIITPCYSMLKKGLSNCSFIVVDT